MTVQTELDKRGTETFNPHRTQGRWHVSEYTRVETLYFQSTSHTGAMTMGHESFSEEWTLSIHIAHRGDDRRNDRNIHKPWSFNPHRTQGRWPQFRPKTTPYFCPNWTNPYLISSDFLFFHLNNLPISFLLCTFSCANPAGILCLLPIRTFHFLRHSIFSSSYSPNNRSWYRYSFNILPNTRQTIAPVNTGRK